MSRLLAALVDLAAAPLATTSAVERADAIAILGAPLRPDGSLTDVLDERVRAGADLFDRGLAPVVCLTGGDRYSASEVDAMAARALELGIPEPALRLDRHARNTRQNAEGVAELLFRGATVWIVTQPFHLRRAAREFRRAGLRPLGWHIADSLQYRRPEKTAYWVAREYLALLRPRLPR